MKIDVKGRVGNTSLAAGKPMLPLNEALVNSIQAIEDLQSSSGKVSIELIRDAQQVLDGEDPHIRPVTDICITDDGVGFTEANFTSFNTSDTTFKKQRGGKGVGRFLWLVAFNEVTVDSVYEAEDGTRRRRKFRFIPRGDGIADHVDELTSAAEQKTTVKLCGFKKKYQAYFPKRPETIASHIAEHCLDYFIRGNCPAIELRDPTTDSVLSLNRLFDKGMLEKSSTEEFEVKGQRFHMTHVRLYSTHANDHQAHYCANDRVVQSSKLSKRVANLPSKLEDDSGKKFVYAAYVGADVLNESVNAERTGFAIAEEGNDLLPEDVGWEEISAAVEEQSKNYLGPYTDPVREQKERRVSDFVKTVAPMYRPVLPYLGDRIDRIDPDADDDDLDIELYRAYHELEVETKEEGTALLRSEYTAASSYEDYKARLEAYFERVTDLKKTDLARYVCQRKAVLDFLQKLLAHRDDGKHHLESEVHNVIFPMGRTTDDVLMEDHNLWLIDEKLAYYAFLASDKQLRVLPTFDGDSQSEPDILAYDIACAFSSSNESLFKAISIVEFKRPMRDDYSEDENPFTQLCDYMDLLRENKAITPDGRPIHITTATPFYCYIVCDKRPRLDKWASRFNLDMTPDELGYFGYNKQYNAYFEVISYQKLVDDAQQRNAIFFERLNLPSKVTPTRTTS